MWKKFVSLALVLTLSGCSLLGAKPKIDDSANTALAPIPEALSAAYTQGLTLLKDKHYEKAQTHWQSVVEQWPTYPGVWTNLALSQWHMEQYAEGLASVQKALEVDAQFCPALALQGLLLRENGQFKEAIASYEKAAQCDPNNPDIPYNLGIVYDLYLQNNAEALVHYQKAQSLQPEADETLNMWVTDLQSRTPKQVVGEAQ